MAQKLYPGGTVDLYCDFATPAGTPTTPTAAKLNLVSPAGVKTTYNYPADVTMTEPSAGRLLVTFSIPRAASSAGDWSVEWEASGAVAQNATDKFTVQSTPFVT